jgi:hypothetical protein
MFARQLELYGITPFKGRITILLFLLAAVLLNPYAAVLPPTSHRKNIV